MLQEPGMIILVSTQRAVIRKEVRMHIGKQLISTCPSEPGLAAAWSGKYFNKLVWACSDFCQDNLCRCLFFSALCF